MRKSRQATPEEVLTHFLRFTSRRRPSENVLEAMVGAIEVWAHAQLAIQGVAGANAIKKRPRVSGGDSMPGRVGDAAAQLLHYVGLLRRAIAKDDAKKAALFALSIGILFVRTDALIEFERDADKGKNFTPDNKGGRNKLYPAAVEVLERLGVDTTTNDVLVELKRAGDVAVRKNVLHWNGKKITRKAFANRLSDLRGDLRKG